MTEFKLIGSSALAVNKDGGAILQGIGFPLHPVEVADIGGDEVLIGESVADQNPAGLDSPLQVEFGAAQPGDDVELLADGTIRIKTAGAYLGRMTAYFSRTTSAGNAFFFMRVLKDGVQQGNPIAVEQTDDDSTIPFFLSLFSLVKGDNIPIDFTIECIRDGQGINSGGLRSITSTNGWGRTPSARISITKN